MVDQYTLEYTEDAEKDIDDHVSYLIETDGNPDRALALYDFIVEDCANKIKENPYRASPYLNGRKFRAPNCPYNIYYVVLEEEKKVIVTNVYHDRQNRAVY